MDHRRSGFSLREQMVFILFYGFSSKTTATIIHFLFSIVHLRSIVRVCPCCPMPFPRHPSCRRRAATRDGPCKRIMCATMCLYRKSTIIPPFTFMIRDKGSSARPTLGETVDFRLGPGQGRRMTILLRICGCKDTIFLPSGKKIIENNASQMDNG